MFFKYFKTIVYLHSKVLLKIIKSLKFKKMKKIVLFSLLLAGSLVFFSACKKTTTTPAPKPGLYIETNATLGKILTDEKGMTLYFFSKDADGQSACVDGCVTTWPIYYNASPYIGTGLKASDFGVITRPDGKKQTTYKGWPLYYFANDNAKGDVNGEGVKNVWFVAKPDYSVMLAVNQLVGLDGVNYLSDYTPGTGLTSYLTDAYGRTLYRFVKDSANVNNYTQAFTSANAAHNGDWPIYEAPLGAVPSIFNKADFSQISVFGKKQMTYKGWPLYYRENDTKRGLTTGVSIPKPGIWPIVNLSTPSAPKASGNGGSGY